jgi:hypothetical protein
LNVVAVFDVVVLIEWLLMMIFPTLPIHMTTDHWRRILIAYFHHYRATQNMSSWTLVYITTTTLLALAFPLKSATWLTTWKAKIVFMVSGGIFFSLGHRKILYGVGSSQILKIAGFVILQSNI